MRDTEPQNLSLECGIIAPPCLKFEIKSGQYNLTNLINELYICTSMLFELYIVDDGLE